LLARAAHLLCLRWRVGVCSDLQADIGAAKLVIEERGEEAAALSANPIALELEAAAKPWFLPPERAVVTTTMARAVS
jgi:hypothetical protein